MSERLTDELRRFVLTSVPSVPFLEAILLLRSDRDAAWETATVARRLYLGDRATVELMAELRAAGITVPDGPRGERHRYHPATVELQERLDALADAYATNLVAVTDLIHSRIDKRAWQFADAFRLRKD